MTLNHPPKRDEYDEKGRFIEELNVWQRQLDYAKNDYSFVIAILSPRQVKESGAYFEKHGYVQAGWFKNANTRHILTLYIWYRAVKAPVKKKARSR